MFIIKIEADEQGFHDWEYQSHRAECWLDGYIAIPEELLPKLYACWGYCHLIIEGGMLMDIIPVEDGEASDN